MTSMNTDQRQEGIRAFRNGISNPKIRDRLACMELSELTQAIKNALEIERELRAFESDKIALVEYAEKCDYCEEYGHKRAECIKFRTLKEDKNASCEWCDKKGQCLKHCEDLKEKRTKCDYCDEIGHKASDCYQLRKSKMICDYCGGKGHNVQDCRHKK